MGVLAKINFPFFTPSGPDEDRDTVVFFGADYYNLPPSTDYQLFRARTDEMLEYIRQNCPGKRLLYQPHPNETIEYAELNLAGFTVGEYMIAELFLYANAPRIAYVFSSCSNASISAYAMGLNSVLFLDSLIGVMPDESITAYRSYFDGLPPEFFITSFEQDLPARVAIEAPDDAGALRQIATAVGAAPKVWVLAADPALALRGAIIVRALKRQRPELRAGLIQIRHKRWGLIDQHRQLFDVFDETVVLPHNKVWYSVRPPKIWAAVAVARAMRRLPLKSGEALLSFSHLLFEENCLLSYYPRLKKIQILENRWYKFVYEQAGEILPSAGFRTSNGVRFFNYVLEPLLHLHRTIYREFKDGRYLNLFRYRRPLEEIYDATFVLMPDTLTITPE